MNKDILRKSCEDGLSGRQIAHIRGCSLTNVQYWLRKYGLKVKRGGRGKLPKDMRRVRICGQCGETDLSKFYGNKRHICGACHNKYVIQKSKEQSIRMREFLGGVCMACGYKKYLTALDIHHIDPDKKDTSFKSIRKWKWGKVIEELKGCVLMCKCCHSAYHSGEMSEEEQKIVEQGVVKTGITFGSGPKEQGFKSLHPDQRI